MVVQEELLHQVVIDTAEVQLLEIIQIAVCIAEDQHQEIIIPVQDTTEEHLEQTVLQDITLHREVTIIIQEEITEAVRLVQAVRPEEITAADILQAEAMEVQAKDIVAVDLPVEVMEEVVQAVALVAAEVVEVAEV